MYMYVCVCVCVCVCVSACVCVHVRVYHKPNRCYFKVAAHTPNPASRATSLPLHAGISATEGYSRSQDTPDYLLPRSRTWSSL